MRLLVVTGLTAACIACAGPGQIRATRSPTERMHTVTSKDGTSIAVWRSGVGSSLLLVHGASYDHRNAWAHVLPELERRFTVYAMDRRGRGGSGDALHYDLQREAEDVAAVIDFIGEPVNVVGHSYGGLCALEAARLTGNVRRLVLYEAVPLSGADAYQPGIIDRLDALLGSGDVEGMLITMMRALVERSPEEIERLRADREGWAVRLVNARTLPRELRAEQGYTFVAERFAGVRVPTLLLVGGNSPARERGNADGVAAALRQVRVEVLPEQGHTAMLLAPQAFVRAVEGFLQP